MKNTSIILFSNITYDHLLKGRTGIMAKELAKKSCQITFVECPCSIFGFLLTPFERQKSVIDFIFPKIRVSNDITIIPQFPLIPLGRFRLLRHINQLILVNWLKRILSKRLENYKEQIAITSTPSWYAVIKQLGINKICYDCIDDVSIFCPSREVELHRKWERGLVKEASLIFAISNELSELILSINPKSDVVILPNGVDMDWFVKQAEKSCPPKELENMKRPIVGYLGSISPWVDTELLCFCANRLREVSFVIVGPVTKKELITKLTMLNNLYLLGSRPYEEVPSYIKAFDVCLIPFKVERIGNVANPLKLYEYLSLGKPVVSTNVTAMQRLKNIIYVADSYEDFIKKIDEALMENGKDANKRENYVVNNTWEKRADTMLAHLLRKFK